MYNSIFFILGTGIFFQTYRRSISIEKKQTLFLLIGLVVVYVGGFIGSALLPWIFDIPEVAYLFNISGGMLIVYGVVKYKLFVLPPISKFFVPTPEASLPTKPKYKLEPGRSNLIIEKESKRRAEMFKDAVSHGMSGIWVTSHLPGKVERRFGLVSTPILSMVAERIKGEATVSPNKLGRAKGILYSYLKRTPPAVVIIDCFYELVATNGFKKALEFLEELKEICSKEGDSLIVVFDPKLFTRRCVEDIEVALAK